jgi:hypothetical protein
MIKAETAKLLETSLVVARSGRKATTESIRERIYPTEYEPWELPCTVALVPRGDGRFMAGGGEAGLQGAGLRAGGQRCPGVERSGPVLFLFLWRDGGAWPCAAAWVGGGEGLVGIGNGFGDSRPG